MHRALPIVTLLGLWLVVAAPAADTARETKKLPHPHWTPDVVFIPTPHDVVDKMLDLAAVGKDDVVCDLGCGDGRIVVAAARKHGCRALGYDIDPRRVEDSRKNVAKNKVGHLVTIEQADIFKVDLSQATVVMLYLNPKYNERLIPQLEKLEPGSRIVSHQFDMRGAQPDRIISIRSKQDGRKHTLYLWKTPLKSRGGSEKRD